MRKTLLSAVALICAATACHAAQHRNADGSISDDVLVQSNGQVIGPANPLPVGQPDSRATGSLAAATLNATYAVALAGGQGVVGFKVSGLSASGATLVPEASNDGGTTWSTVNAVAPGTGGLTQALTADQQFRINGAGHTHVRLRVANVGTGTVAVASNASSESGLVALSGSLPAGANLIGAVQTPIPVAIVTGQVRIATTGTAVQLPSAALVNGIVVKARATNAANGFVGPSSVATTYDGTGTGYPIEPGAAASFATSNAGAVWVNGTAGDVFSFEGN